MSDPATEKRQEEAYWLAVKACLIRFHGLTEDGADKALESYAENVLARMTRPDLVFHEEPFYLASEIANHEIPLSKVRNEYESLLASMA